MFAQEDGDTEEQGDEPTSTSAAFKHQLNEQITRESQLPDSSLFVEAENFFEENESDCKSKNRRPDTRVKWSEQEEAEIEKCFSKFLKGQKKPQTKDYQKILSKSTILKDRSVSSLKNKVLRLLKQTAKAN